MVASSRKKEDLRHDLEELSAAITGRRVSPFAGSLAASSSRMEDLFFGSRILVTGGGGFIAGQALRLVLPFQPAKVVVADIGENSLAELVRDLRAEGAIPDRTRFEPRLVDVVGPLLPRLFREDGPFDVVLAFAAAKHVRSERDPVSALHMLNVNVNGTYRVAAEAFAANPHCQVFVVSTDKAADPSSFMGASKRLMEMIVLGYMPSATTTRFANVAFSSGSLLESWLIRLGRGQVLPVPADTERFLVSPREAGELCVMACLAPGGSIAVPEPGVLNSILLTEALERLMSHLGLEASIVESAEPLGQAVEMGSVRPVLITPRDTSGEKAAEVFVGAGEKQVGWLPGISVVRSSLDGAAAAEFAQWVERSLGSDPGPDLAEIAVELGRAVPEFRHAGSRLRLDDRV